LWRKKPLLRRETDGRQRLLQSTGASSRARCRPKRDLCLLLAGNYSGAFIMLTSRSRRPITPIAFQVCRPGRLPIRAERSGSGPASREHGVLLFRQRRKRTSPICSQSRRAQPQCCRLSPRPRNALSADRLGALYWKMNIEDASGCAIFAGSKPVFFRVVSGLVRSAAIGTDFATSELSINQIKSGRSLSYYRSSNAPFAVPPDLRLWWRGSSFLSADVCSEPARSIAKSPVPR